nr:malate:quinone oxidoreductase [Flavihumibacter fluvii]
MIKSGLDNMDFTKYLISQVMQSPDDWLETLGIFPPGTRGRLGIGNCGAKGAGDQERPRTWWNYWK